MLHFTYSGLRLTTALMDSYFLRKIVFILNNRFLNFLNQGYFSSNKAKRMLVQCIKAMLKKIVQQIKTNRGESLAFMIFLFFNLSCCCTRPNKREPSEKFFSLNNINYEQIFLKTCVNSTTGFFTQNKQAIYLATLSSEELMN